MKKDDEKPRPMGQPRYSLQVAMRTNRISFSILILTIGILAGCQKHLTAPPENSKMSGLPDGFAGYRALRYDSIATAPSYTQTSMLTLYQNKLYRIASRWPTRVWDLGTSSWSQISLPDSSYWRWDGAAVTLGDSIFVAAVFYNTSYDILVLHPPTGTYRHTHADLPAAFSFPAFCTYQDELVLLACATDSVLSYNTDTGVLHAIAANPFAGGHVWFPLSSGRYGNALYVFGTQAPAFTIAFMRFDLTTRSWQSIPLPAVVTSGMAVGGVLGDEFVLMHDPHGTFQYSFADQSWYIDTARVSPLLAADGSFEIGQWSFCQADSCLYGSEIYSQKIWRIRR